MSSAASRILKDVFGYDAFRGQQAAIIQRAALFNNRVTVRRTNLEDVFINLTGERIE